MHCMHSIPSLPFLFPYPSPPVTPPFPFPKEVNKKLSYRIADRIFSASMHHKNAQQYTVGERTVFMRTVHQFRLSFLVVTCLPSGAT